MTEACSPSICSLLPAFLSLSPSSASTPPFLPFCLPAYCLPPALSASFSPSLTAYLPSSHPRSLPPSLPPCLPPSLCPFWLQSTSALLPPAGRKKESAPCKGRDGQKALSLTHTHTHTHTYTQPTYLPAWYGLSEKPPHPPDHTRPGPASQFSHPTQTDHCGPRLVHTQWAGLQCPSGLMAQTNRLLWHA